MHIGVTVIIAVNFSAVFISWVIWEYISNVAFLVDKPWFSYIFNLKQSASFEVMECHNWWMRNNVMWYNWMCYCMRCDQRMMDYWSRMMNYWRRMMNYWCSNNWTVMYNDRTMINVWRRICMEVNSTLLLNWTFCICGGFFWR